MNDQIQSSVQAGLKFLATNQLAHGGFRGLSSRKSTFDGVVVTDTIFFTALIANCLANVDGSGVIRRGAAQYLLAHKSGNWSWNYWERGTTARPYPDDLDDTACAVTSIIACDPKLVDARAQALLARSIIACETQPGGPYVTWIMPIGTTGWCDVDPAVNANIGYMLHKLGVRSDALEAYISDCIECGKLQSPYYVGIVPTLYFIARWYRGPQRERLAELVLQSFKPRRQSPLERAMLITAAVNLGIKAKINSAYIDDLLRLQQQGCWPAGALYYEPPEDGQWCYAGSTELTTAFVIEALAVWNKSSVMAITTTTTPQTLSRLYAGLLEAQDQPQVTAIAGVITRAGGWRLKESTIRHLNRGSRKGWLAYTIYDNFLDNEGDTKYLGAANLAMRQSIAHFRQAIQAPDFNRFVEVTFTQVDAANTWEVLHARSLKKLPEYGFYAKLAQRSWGHVIAPTGVLVAAGFALDGPEVSQLHNFFRHYIIAKQLCDDAHDWLEDLRGHRVTPVVAMLLKGCTELDDAARQLYFWRHTINQVNQAVRRQLVLARTALEDCEFLVRKTELKTWLDDVEASCLRAEQGREAAQQFITTFTQSNLVN